MLLGLVIKNILAKNRKDIDINILCLKLFMVLIYISKLEYLNILTIIFRVSFLLSVMIIPIIENRPNSNNVILFNITT